MEFKSRKSITDIGSLFLEYFSPEETIVIEIYLNGEVVVIIPNNGNDAVYELILSDIIDNLDRELTITLEEIRKVVMQLIENN